jgi:hypothetical protein
MTESLSVIPTPLPGILLGVPLIGIPVRAVGRKAFQSLQRNAVEAASSRNGCDLRVKDLEPGVEARCLGTKLARHVGLSDGSRDRGGVQQRPGVGGAQPGGTLGSPSLTVAVISGIAITRYRSREDRCLSYPEVSA